MVYKRLQTVPNTKITVETFGKHSDTVIQGTSLREKRSANILQSSASSCKYL